MKKILCLLMACCLLLSFGSCLAEEVVLLPEDVISNQWFRDQNAKLKVGNPTPLTGRFFTSMWGGTTSDLDVQDLLHAYSPIRWDGEMGRFRFDHSVVEDALITEDPEGNRSFLLVLADDLCWSDGSPITAGDYAFSILLQMDRSVAETGGQPPDFSWLAGAGDYLSGEAKTVSGLRLIADNILQITMTAESLPYFYELNRLAVLPYPISEIAPGTKVIDEGEGVCLTQPLTAELLEEYVLDEKIGYLSHPRVTSGPYVLEDFDGKTAKFAINPLYKGNEAGMVPRIGEIEYTLAENADMIEKLADGKYDLLNKVTQADSINGGINLLRSGTESFAMENEMRTGLTMIWFMESSTLAQDPAIRKAIAYCFDRNGFVSRYTGAYGLRTDGFYGLGQWMYRMAAKLAEPLATMSENSTAQEESAHETAAEEWESITLDGMTLYEYNPDEAIRLVEEAGWNLNKDGEPFDIKKDTVRYKQSGDGLTGLILSLAMPDSGDARIALEACLADRLRQAGIGLKIRTIDMETLHKAYDGRAEIDVDMLYLGENFTIVFDPEILAPHMQGTELGMVKEELYAMAQDMVRTEPEDLSGFERKWIRLQERITETLPLIPVYSNVYFDFFNRRLHNYLITQFPTWGEAIVSAYMSDTEEISEEEKQRLQEQLEEADEQRFQTESEQEAE